jgi:hypothetical protein
MTSDDPRVPEYDPESVGLPDTVDPDSTAYDEDESVREADGDPVMWPDDRPLALDEFGTNALAGQGESLDEQLARETPDVGAEDSLAAAEPDDARDDSSDDDDSDDDSDDQLPDEADDGPDPYAEDEAEDAEGFRGALEDDEPVNPYEESDPVGRLADDERSDPNDRSFADDVGMAGGGASVEESAMHVVGDDDQDADF